MWKKSEPEAPEQSSSFTTPSTESVASPQTKPQSGGQSVIGSSISVKGELSGEENLLIEGEIEGKIVLHNNNVTIGKNGRIKADIHGKTITIDGNVEGNLFGAEQLIVRQSGIVRGNLVAPKVALEEGCNFKGNIDMSQKETSTPAASIVSISSDDSDTDSI